MSGGVRRVEVPLRVRSALSELEPVHYLDAYATFLDPARFGSIAEVAALFERPSLGPMRVLVAIRDAAVRPWGLRPVRSFLRSTTVTADEFVFGGGDRHLDFRGSMLLEDPGPEGSRLVVSTLVHYNNRFGPVYFAVVKPFHQLLMRLMLRSRFR